MISSTQQLVLLARHAGVEAGQAERGGRGGRGEAGRAGRRPLGGQGEAGRAEGGGRAGRGEAGRAGRHPLAEVRPPEVSRPRGVKGDPRTVRGLHWSLLLDVAGARVSLIAPIVRMSPPAAAAAVGSPRFVRMGR